MKYIIFILLFLSFVFNSCNSEDNIKQTNSSANTEIKTKTEKDKDKKTEESEIIKSENILVIKGKDIWIRNKPISGKVIMKLNTGDTCNILEMTNEDQVRDMFDYWYKIEFEGKTGWVFGAQTNKKSREIHDIVPFEKYFGEIARKYNGNTDEMFFYEHKDIPFILLYNMGAFCTKYSTESDIGILSEKISDDDIYNKKPKGDFCEGYPGVKSGFYYWTIKPKDLPAYADMSDEELKVIKFELPEKYTNNTLIKLQVIINEYHFSYMFFINIGETWYLMCENRCDCSA